MHGLQIAHVLSVTALLSVAGGCVPASSSKSVPATDAVVPWRVPDGGRLPHAVIDDEGTTHLVYLKGEPVEGDLMYVTRGPGATTWSEPAQVNSEPGTVTGIGPIDGGHLAQGRDTCHMPGARDQKSWDAGLKRIALVRSTRAWYSVHRR